MSKKGKRNKSNSNAAPVIVRAVLVYVGKSIHVLIGSKNKIKRAIGSFENHDCTSRLWENESAEKVREYVSEWQNYPKSSASRCSVTITDMTKKESVA